MTAANGLLQRASAMPQYAIAHAGSVVAALEALDRRAEFERMQQRQRAVERG